MPPSRFDCRTFSIVFFVLAGLLGFTPPVSAMTTTYIISNANNTFGSYTLDQPLNMTPERVLEWDFVFRGNEFDSTVDPVVEQNCLVVDSICFMQGENSEGAFYELNVSVPDGAWAVAGDGATGTYSRQGESVLTAAVPAPGTFPLLASGLLCLAGYRWQQRRREGAQVG